ncbi:MAG: protein kinase [Ectothiorhodospiraceae bacterium]|nr:protein kinase [Ectothiorhodospiraceae bacterium]
MELSGYEIQERIGQGGMAIVYRATQRSLGRTVALKILHPLHAGTPEFTERFLNEGRLLAALTHPNVVTIHDIGVEGDLHYIAMEYVPDGSLARRIARGMDAEAALACAMQIAGALGAAHARSIVHRDVKPSNVLFRADGSLVLTDFGIAKRLGTADLTETGTTVGSPHYLSPEQARGQLVDARSDIYSLGVLLFEMLTGHKPYQGASDLDTAWMHVHEPVPEFPPELAPIATVLGRMLAKDPADRFSDCASLVAALRQVQEATRRPGAPRMHRAPPGDGFHEAPTTMSPEVVAVGADALAAAGARPHRRRLATGLAAAVALAVGGVGLAAWLDRAPAPTSRFTSPVGGPTADTAGRPDLLAAVTPPAVTPPPVPPSPEPSAPPVPRSTTGASTETPWLADLPGRRPAPEASRIASGPDDGTRGDTAVDTTRDPERVATADVPGTPTTTSMPSQADPAVLAPATRAATRVRASHAPAPPAAAAKAVRIDRLMAAADTAMSENRLTIPDGDNAVEYYQQVLEVDPAHVPARAGIERVAARYGRMARERLEDGDLAQARTFVDRGLAVRPDDRGLRALRAEIAIAAAPTDLAPPRRPGPSPAGEIRGESPRELLNRIRRFLAQ